ncbi:sensor histidine kinase [Methanocella arvoryzae]|uniref:histidine kinase n=1 Tax=Methanocella arvoryzae (strain DSM 22066 / NBRC 105507 / MRE50) TaxID=351160 RepID=Q0W0C2_METAR|nr:sensor histidine kinase [Methanocella arvoryzae]CAJ38171.1 putative signal transduction histidine kinase [Methanocella arvoryzae MRE50]
MLPLSSIKFHAIILIAILVIASAAVIGGASVLYNREVIKHEIWDNNLAVAKSTSALTVNYMDLARTYLTSLADRPLVIKAIQEKDIAFLDFNAQYAVNQSEQLTSVFFTDQSGTVISSYPYTQRIGESYIDRPYVGEVLNTSEPVISSVQISPYTGQPTVYFGIPIMDNTTAIGTLIGSVNLANFRDLLAETQVKENHFVYLVNKSGRVMVHSNSSYMDKMADFSSIPAVASVIRGEEGIVEQYFPFENDQRLVAYTPVTQYGWGVVVATPVDVAYKPINDSMWLFITFIAGLLILSLLIAMIVGKYITDPILKINSATSYIPDGDPERLKAFLPVGRKDGIGSLARSFITMASTIKSDRERVIAAMNQAEEARAHAESERERAEEEKNRAELYVDIMGHDINNLNQAALANLELLEMDESLTDEQRATIEDALVAVKGSASVIDSVRTIQRATEEKITLENVDINDYVVQCITEAPRPKGRKVTINYQPRKGLLVKGSSLLKAVFCNLISNAVKHSTGDVTIDIYVRSTEKLSKPFWEIAIEDDGPGIPDAVKPRLFARFQRGTTKAKGRGLGLFIVRTLAERFGGSVTMEDRVPGDHTKGSRFIVTLPVSADK